MEELSSNVWRYEQAIEELDKRLVYTTVELESLKKEASEEISRQKEYILDLIKLLGLAYQQRDDAKDRLQRLLNIVKTSPQLNPILPLTYSQSPLLMPAYANSSITESNSVTETYNGQYSDGSPAVDSLFNVVPSLDFSSINVVDSRQLGDYVNQQPFVQDFNGLNPSTLVPFGVPEIDRATNVIDRFVMGKALPQKGKLKQAMKEAGPLLQTLIVGGPTPRLSNPPSMQPFKIPPGTVKSLEAANQNPNVAAAADTNRVVQEPISPPSTYNMPSQICSASMLSDVYSLSSGQNDGLLSSVTCVPTTKRQRYH